MEKIFLTKKHASLYIFLMSNDLNNKLAKLLGSIDALRHKQAEESRSLYQIGDEVKFVYDSFQRNPIGTSTPGYREFYGYVDQFQNTIDAVWNRTGENIRHLSAGTFVTSSAAEVYTNAYPYELKSFNIGLDALRSRTDDRASVSTVLSKHNSVIADMFDSSWQTLEQATVDPSRGPAFLMREAVSQFLHHFSPNEKVQAKEWWTPYDKKNGITRKDRTRFIFEDVLIPSKSETQKLELEGLVDLYQKLNSAHDHNPLETDKIKPLLYQAQDLFKGILAFIE